MFNELKESYKPEVPAEQPKTEKPKEEKNNEEKKYLTQNLSKYNKREQKLITKIYTIIKAILPREMADMVVAKIQEELSK